MLKEEDSEALAFVEAAEAYQAALPLLFGDENIRDFIACVTFGLATTRLLHEVAARLLYAAQIAYNVTSPRTKISKKSHKLLDKCLALSPLGPKSVPPPPPTKNHPPIHLIAENK